MNANRHHSTTPNQSATLVATLAEVPEFEVETLATFEEFSRQFDEELAELELRYAAFCTHDSLRLSVGR